MDAVINNYINSAMKDIDSDIVNDSVVSEEIKNSVEFNKKLYGSNHASSNVEHIIRNFYINKFSISELKKDKLNTLLLIDKEYRKNHMMPSHPLCQLIVYKL